MRVEQKTFLSWSNVVKPLLVMIGRRVQHTNKKWLYIHDSIIDSDSYNIPVTKYLVENEEGQITLIKPEDVIAVEKVNVTLEERERYLKELISFLNLK